MALLGYVYMQNMSVKQMRDVNIHIYENIVYM